MDDSEIDNLLRSANQQISLPKSFNRNVWNRIESSEMDSSRAVVWIDRIFTTLTRPVGAAATITLAAVLGLWLGSTGLDATDAELNYAKTVSPFLAPKAK
jgi:hypothetical protein